VGLNGSCELRHWLGTAGFQQPGWSLPCPSTFLSAATLIGLAAREANVELGLGRQWYPRHRSTSAAPGHMADAASQLAVVLSGLFVGEAGPWSARPRSLDDENE
jgi:hypothetical protein